MKTCVHCGKDYKPLTEAQVRRLGALADTFEEVMLPSCECSKKIRALENKKGQRKEEEDRWRKSFLNLRFPLRPLQKKPYIDVGGWYSDIWLKLAFGAKLVIYGESGSGKTQTMRTIAAKALWSNVAVRGGSLRLIFDQMKDSFKIREVRDWMMGGELLLLDDIPHTGLSQFESDSLLMFLDHYDVEGKAVILSSNVPKPEMLGAWMLKSQSAAEIQKVRAIISRIRHRADFICSGEWDYRSHPEGPPKK